MITGGVQIVFNNFPEIISGMEPQAGKAVAETARAVATGAAQRAPRRTGTLAGSYQAASAGAAYQWQVSSDVDYATYVEYGSGRGPAQPHATPAAEAERNPFADRLSRYVVGQ